jgi:hypothetical protein
VVCPSEREEVPIWLDPAETKDVPCRVLFECGLQRRVQRNGPAFSGFRLAPAGRQELLFEIDMKPLQVLDLTAAQTCVQREHQSWVYRRRSRLLGGLHAARLLLRGIRLGNLFGALKSEAFLLLQAGTDNVTDVAAFGKRPEPSESTPFGSG